MKFDPTKPHGAITGHPTAFFEQEGVLFDGAGQPLSEPKTSLKAKASAAATDDPKVESAKAFLRAVLAGGPVSKSAVFREAEANNQDWAAAKTAFVVLKGTEIKRGSEILWKLVEA